jgi:lipoate-protein ligase A
MYCLDLTLSSAQENLALDEALLDWAEEKNSEAEFLRFWESPEPVVVVGRSSRISLEVDEEACQKRNTPILRRSSGGAAIVAGPGCLMYAVVLSYRLRPELRDIGRAHSFVLNRLAQSIGSLFAAPARITYEGTSDLVLADRSSASAARKFSGNSLRAKRTHLLYHGTLLYNFNLQLIDTYLRMPPRQPEYRGSRAHLDFVANLPVDRQVLVNAVGRAWPTSGELNDWPREQLVTRLVRERFSQDSWNREFD